MSTIADLVVLVADSHQETVISTLLLERRAALGLRPISVNIYVHPRADPGVYRQAAGFLAAFARSHAHALVLLDTQFPGSPGSRTAIESGLAAQLAAKGWPDRSQVVAIEPELEAWVWSDSPHVAQVLRHTHAQIRRMARARDWWPAAAAKPTHPKELLAALLSEIRRPPSAAVFAELAQRVSLQRCTDPAFDKLCATLRDWFAAPVADNF